MSGTLTVKNVNGKTKFQPSIQVITGGIIGVSKISGERILNEIQNSFYNHNDVKAIFQLEDNRLKMKAIPQATLENAIRNHNTDIRSLAYAYYLAINSSTSHYVDMTFTYETLNNRSITALPSFHLSPNSKGLEIDKQAGGGVNTSYLGGTLTVVVMDSKADIGDFTYAPNGVQYPRHSTPAELLAHELLGHGYGRIIGSSTYRHEDAIRMSNLYWRARGYHNFYRNASSHGTGFLLTKASANQIPTHFQK
ncbi:hypothetical protein SAMN05421639_1072 [Chryseobacterium shigense]|uniref:Uncharacterized protein n=1 Tax=Chryseobacterium shigense TaxID=297244 RepID=A0A1N7JK24_9FLAO|nr:hypothetical protein [Chryseobacterium shigense]SIS49677.1 hypothetical protein SAMN05421639_1072 [Chryseobacterium shigense]